ncbi:hypothetical protein E4U42_004521 [Claviceps africana]|uniref:Uncharacterized protein n=1 Tax=Claviceps africana TaxID=83212 RepID=A0A8K0JBZ5_9HYPO|nr:hypothetical protein E4U42_004521 [Claviceps africana]
MQFSTSAVLAVLAFCAGQGAAAGPGAAGGDPSLPVGSRSNPQLVTGCRADRAAKKLVCPGPIVVSQGDDMATISNGGNTFIQVWLSCGRECLVGSTTDPNGGSTKVPCKCPGLPEITVKRFWLPDPPNYGAWP